MSIATPTDFVLSLQALKKSAADLEKLSFQERLDHLGRLPERFDVVTWSGAVAEEEFLPLEFVRAEVIEASMTYIKEFVRQESGKSFSFHRPLGVVGISLPGLFSFRLALERFLPAWLAGNPTLIHFSERSIRVAEIFAELLKDLCPGSWKILVGNKKEILPLMAAHPGLASFLFVGHERNRVSLIQAAAPSGKRLHMSLSAKNSLIFLSLPESQERLKQQLQSCFIGAGQSSFNSHRIFILDSFRDQFLDWLKKILDEDPPLLRLQKESRVGKLLEIKSRIEDEQGKIFWGGDKEKSNTVTPLFSVDLSNCSVWQQEDLQVPYFIISSVKYSHEIAKWSNTGSYGHSAVIYGDEEKARNFSSKLFVGLVQINRWSLPWSKNFSPQKLSSHGFCQFVSEDHFFSESQSRVE